MSLVPGRNQATAVRRQSCQMTAHSRILLCGMVLCSLWLGAIAQNSSPGPTTYTTASGTITTLLGNDASISGSFADGTQFSATNEDEYISVDFGNGACAGNYNVTSGGPILGLKKAASASSGSPSFALVSLAVVFGVAVMANRRLCVSSKLNTVDQLALAEAARSFGAAADPFVFVWSSCSSHVPSIERCCGDVVVPACACLGSLYVPALVLILWAGLTRRVLREAEWRKRTVKPTHNSSTNTLGDDTKPLATASAATAQDGKCQAELPDLEASAAAGQERLNARVVANWRMLVEEEQKLQAKVLALAARRKKLIREPENTNDPNGSTVQADIDSTEAKFHEATAAHESVMEEVQKAFEVKVNAGV
ncbi:hypothetical protein WJX77_012376 [Trebouxia sp. C0004]